MSPSLTGSTQPPGLSINSPSSTAIPFGPFLKHLLSTYYEQDSLLVSSTCKGGYDFVAALKGTVSRRNSLNLASCLINWGFLLWSQTSVLCDPLWDPSSDRFLIVSKHPCLCLGILAPSWELILWGRGQEACRVKLEFKGDWVLS